MKISNNLIFNLVVLLGFTLEAMENLHEIANKHKRLTILKILKARTDEETIDFLQHSTPEDIALIFVMHACALKGFVKAMRYLHSQGLALDTSLSQGKLQGYCPKHLAALAGHVNVLELLHGQHVDLNAPTEDEMHFCPIHIATLLSHQVPVIDFLLGLGISYSTPVTAGPFEGLLPIHLAVMGEDMSIIKCLQRHGADLDSKYQEAPVFYAGVTPLMVAAAGLTEVPPEDIIRYLIWQGVAIPPITHLITSIKISKYLADIAPKTQALIQACEHIRLMNIQNSAAIPVLQQIGTLICQGAEFNVSDRFGRTPLHCLINRYDMKNASPFDECVRLLVRHGADINFIDSEGYTPLGRACELGNKRLIRYFIFKKADLALGRNPITTAIDNGHMELAFIMIRLGCNIFDRPFYAFDNDDAPSTTGKSRFKCVIS